jgi:hypothetical protein
MKAIFTPGRACVRSRAQNHLSKHIFLVARYFLIEPHEKEETRRLCAYAKESSKNRNSNREKSTDERGGKLRRFTHDWEDRGGNGNEMGGEYEGCWLKFVKREI